MDPLVIVGTGGSASDVLDIVEALRARGEGVSVAGFLDDAHPERAEHLGHPVLGRIEQAAALSRHRFINAIGSDNSYRMRPRIIASMGVPADRFATLVHPRATVSPGASLGRGVYVAAGALVGGGVRVGDFATLHPGCIIGHDTEIGPYAVISPGAVVGGYARVGLCAYVGAGATVRQGLEVGELALVGMAAVVTRTVAPESVVAGNPARPLRSRVDGGKGRT